MKLKDNFYDVNENCTFENDKLNREIIANRLTSILKSAETSPQGLILALNAQWGNGKTTFIKMWKNMLDKDYKIPNLYFSAWEEDYTKEPLIAVLGELNRYLTKNKIQNENFNQAVESVQKIFKRILPTLLKISVKGLFNKIGIDNELLQEASQAFTEESAKTLIEDYSKEKECLTQLKENLTKVFEVTGAKEEQPFIIFIDEIDRCRPTYAIEMLENIKHLFGIPNLVFVISIDKAQLSKSIQAIYGQIDTENYLRRFFDLEVALPNPSLQDFCSYLQEELDIKTKTSLSDIFITNNFTLRELQKIAPQIKLAGVYFQNQGIDMRRAIFILLLKIYKPDLYSQIPNITDTKGVMEIIEKLVCKDDILNEEFLIEYIKTTYSVCKNAFSRDSNFLHNPHDYCYDNIKKQWFKDGKLVEESFSCVVETYKDILTEKKLSKNWISEITDDKTIKTITEFINFAAEPITSLEFRDNVF
ncbi:P-loop NTPase fold protein [Helicobacter sp.]|uniref:KAP family P-loop NTPase fold protein n=1 Tax=Helicobacter sp. TaxID=218 RepID=UPI00198B668E|nr:P-loop NTPase fold protein [Helicobacter sp.]MBD5164578.1 hypothetical protein [Helicobacter sp.]